MRSEAWNPGGLPEGGGIQADSTRDLDGPAGVRRQKPPEIMTVVVPGEQWIMGNTLSS